MNKAEAAQVILTLKEQGFIVEWFDATGELFLIRAIPARAA